MLELLSSTILMFLLLLLWLIMTVNSQLLRIDLWWWLWLRCRCLRNTGRYLFNNYLWYFEYWLLWSICLLRWNIRYDHIILYFRLLFLLLSLLLLLFLFVLWFLDRLLFRILSLVLQQGSEFCSWAIIGRVDSHSRLLDKWLMSFSSSYFHLNV